MTDSSKEIERTLGLGQRRRRVPAWAYWIAALIVAAGLAAWWLQATDDNSALRYVTEPVAQRDLTVTVTATGTIEPTNLVEISTEISGTITAVHVDFNDLVTEGQDLAALDTIQLEAQLAVQEAALGVAEAQVASALSSLSEARVNLDRIRTLDERGVASHTELTTAQAVFDRALAEMRRARANSDLAQAQLDAQQAELDKAVLRSPIDGIILDRAVDEGQIVAASLSAPILFTIAEDLTQMELRVDVAEADIGRIAVGNPASFTVDAHDDTLFPAEIEQVRFASENVDGLVTYKAILSVRNDDLLLRPGMTATADITVAAYEDVVVVPNAALRYAPPQMVDEDEGEDDRGSGLLGLILPSSPPGNGAGRDAASATTVWVLRDGVATEVEVEKGDSDGLFTVVRSGDLAPGDAVIVDAVEGR